MRPFLFAFTVSYAVTAFSPYLARGTEDSALMMLGFMGSDSERKEENPAIKVHQNRDVEADAPSKATSLEHRQKSAEPRSKRPTQ